MQLDFTNVKTLDTNPVPAGEYYIQVVACKPSVSKNGKPMIEWQFRIADGEYENRRLFMNNVLQENSLWKLKQTLQGLGFTEEDLEGPIDFEPGEMIGLEAYANVTMRLYEGVQRNNVERLISIDDINKRSGNYNPADYEPRDAVAPPAQPTQQVTETEDLMPPWGEDAEIDFSTNQTNGTAEKTATVAAAVATPSTATATVDVDDDDEAEVVVPAVVLDVAKPAARLAATYGVTPEEVYAFTGNPTISKQDVLNFVASREDDNDE
jgi:hypothetical protein